MARTCNACAVCTLSGALCAGKLCQRFLYVMLIMLTFRVLPRSHVDIRYPPRIEEGIDDMFHVCEPGVSAEKIKEMLESLGDGPEFSTLRKIMTPSEDRWAPHFLFRPGVPGCDGMHESPLSVQAPPPGRKVSTRQVWFNQRDLVGAFELDLYTGARRAVRRIRNRDGMN